MKGSNCDGTGGWTRVAYLNMTEPGAACPGELQQLTYNTIDHPLCGRRNSSSSGCSSTNFTSAGLNYTEVCGQVRGYQYGSPDAFYTPSAGIESYYVDGISITHGQNPRHHIWTYAGGYQSQNVDQWSCPCNTGYNGGRNPGSYVGNHYYCESGVPAGNGYQIILYPNDILWDGKQCDGYEGPCCNSSSLPWFYRRLNEQTRDDIEMRICAHEGTSIDDTPIDVVELYIR